MNSALILSLAVAWLAAAGGAYAQNSASRPAPKTEVVVVTGGPGPKLVTSFPADGAQAVPAGILALKIVFDQPMTPQGWSYSRVDSGAFPNCLERPRLLADQRTFVLLCSVAANQAYAIDINAPKDFASAGGRLAKAAQLHFSTGAIGTWDMHDALQKAGLTDADEPIMEWRDPGAGVSQNSARPADSDDRP